MTSENKAEDPLMSVQFYIKSESFSFRVTVHLLFSFLLQKTLKSVFLPHYESLKLNYVTKYSMTSEDTVEDPLKSVQFYIKRSTVFFFIAKALKFVSLPRYKSLKLNHDIKLFDLKSEDTVMNGSVFISCYSASTLFIFITKDA